MAELKICRQKNGFCGLACLQTVFYQYGIKYSQRQLARIMNPKTENGLKVVDWVEKDGSNPEDMDKLCKKFGFRSFLEYKCTLPQLKKYLDDKLHLVVGIYDPDYEDEHHLLALELNDREIVLGDPHIGGPREMDLPTFMANWRETNMYLRERLRERLALVIYPKS